MTDKEWHKAVCERDDYTCTFCKKYYNFPMYFNEEGINQYVCGDHIKTKGSHPELRLDVSNGRCVCLECHNKRHDGNIEEKKPRTILQNKALHLYFQMVADALNDAGYDMKRALKPHVEIPWSKDSVKTFMWKPIQEVLIGEKSTTQLSTKDIDKVFDVLNRHLGEKFEIHEGFPSIETIMLKLDNPTK